MIVVGDNKLYEVVRWVILDSEAPLLVKQAAFALLPNAFVNKPTGLDMVSTGTREEIAELCRVGRRIEAIKTLRTYTGMALKDAKDTIDREFPIPRENPPGE